MAEYVVDILGFEKIVGDSPEEAAEQVLLWLRDGMSPIMTVREVRSGVETKVDTAMWEDEWWEIPMAGGDEQC